MLEKRTIDPNHRPRPRRGWWVVIALLLLALSATESRRARFHHGPASDARVAAVCVATTRVEAIRVATTSVESSGVEATLDFECDPLRDGSAPVDRPSDGAEPPGDRDTLSPEAIERWCVRVSNRHSATGLAPEAARSVRPGRP